jgi:hypothetical protein
MTSPFSINDFNNAFARIGQYMHHWANMEAALDSSIEAALKVGLIHQTILCSNLQFHSKCKILKSLVRLSKVSQKSEHIKMLSKVESLSADRNMVAHTQFYPDELDKMSVKFFRNRSEGELKLEHQTWTIDLFKMKFEELIKYNVQLAALSTQLDGLELSSSHKISTNSIRVLRSLPISSRD